MDASTSASPSSPLNITNSKNGNECGTQATVDEACHDFLSDEDIVAINGEGDLLLSDEDIVAINEEGDPLLIDAEAALASGASIEPAIRTVFTDEDEAYDYYNKYAKLLGFGKKTGRTIWKHGGRISWILKCCRQGFRSEMYHGSENACPHPKCGCQEKNRIKKNNRWVLAKVVKEYNHILTKPNKTRFICFHRKISNTVKRVIDTLESSMTKSRVTIDYLIEEAGGAKMLLSLRKTLRIT
ncbi:protein FAR1-RELATED SEQUENCE 5-like [Amborella trichopoda]|uniref:protein FAR1-RELATED SEQUENCE 5-like n=1 Tax=Amborella trichopoda TaxID=13333 RepID=UPI0009BF7BD8|nr:protein FAR1-RELATED SEQUENCE 5-like [Amborella trichopoda]|eukprot:XP_020525872.1 protein FAR1-RELATED SEQUENCE 5-like [Amborella trichopoda]